VLRNMSEAVETELQGSVKQMQKQAQRVMQQQTTPREVK
jgi:hypothetical protein